MKVIGLDISIAATGYCIVDEHKGLKDWGVVKTAPKGYESDTRRFDDISTEIFSRVADYGCGAVFVENYAYAAPGNIMRVAELTGIIKCDFLHNFGVEQGDGLFVVAPSTLKKYALGSGVGDKGLILKAIFKKWGMDTDENNIGDAYVLARMGVDFLGYTKDDTFTCQHKYEDECIKAVAKQNGVKLERRKK